MITLIAHPKTNHLIESMQANKIKFAFVGQPVDGQAQLLHQWVQCREYFNELLMKNHHPDEFTFVPTYNFDYKYEDYPLDMSCIRIALKFPNAETRDTFNRNLVYLHHIENQYHLERTTIDKTSNSLVWVITGSKFWLQKCLLLNIYTMVLKLCSLGMNEQDWDELCKLRINAYMPSEISYICNISYPVWQEVLQNLQELHDLKSTYVDGWDTLRQAYTVHGNTGIVTIYQCAVNAHFQKGMKDTPVALWMKDVVKKAQKQEKEAA